MVILSYILFALSLGLVAMLKMARVAKSSSIRLTYGLLVSFVTAVIGGGLVLGGEAIGGSLRISEAGYEMFNEAIFIAVAVVVGVKLLIEGFRKKEEEEPDLSRIGTMLALAIALGINGFLIGLGDGFLGGQLFKNGLGLSIGVAASSLVASYMGIMFGRRGLAFTKKKWMVAAVLLLLSAVVLRIIQLPQ